MDNVCFLFGINGVGKSTLASAIAARLPDTTVISSSVLLRAALGGVTRAWLEQADPLVKQAMLHKAMTEAFHRHATAPLVICDMHLTVQIAADDHWRYEHMWSPTLVPFTKAAFCVTAPLSQVIARRHADLATGRQRSICAQAAAEHDQLEQEDFRQHFRPGPRACIINNERPIGDVADDIMQRLAIR
jgi:thymidylate kinase